MKQIIFIAFLALYVTIAPIVVHKYVTKAQEEQIEQIVNAYDSLRSQDKQIYFNF